MTRESGQYRKMLLEQQERPGYRLFMGGGEGSEVPWYRVRFYVSLILFLCYVMLDYTGVSFYTLDSAEVALQVQRDMAKEIHMDTLLAQMMRQVEITEEEGLPVQGEALEKEAGAQDLAEENRVEDGEKASEYAY